MYGKTPSSSILCMLGVHPHPRDFCFELAPLPKNPGSAPVMFLVHHLNGKFKKCVEKMPTSTFEKSRF